MEIKRAKREYRNLKIGVGGVTGTGKTLGALKLAFGITGDWSKICVIDSENGSASLYAHLGPFDVINLPAFDANTYIDAINMVLKTGNYNVMIIDSMTHEWSGPGGILDYVEKMAETITRGNTYAAWKYGTALHNKFVDAWLLAPIHVICTMRKKDDTIIEQNDKGKATPRKVGLKNIQRDGLDYEFDLAIDIHKNHHCSVDKDRTMLFNGAPPFELTESVGQKLIAWSKAGVSVSTPASAVEDNTQEKPVESQPESDVAKKTGYQGTKTQTAWLIDQLKKRDIDDSLWPAIEEAIKGRPASDLNDAINEVIIAKGVFEGAEAPLSSS